MPDPLAEALELALRALSRRERTVAELEGHLRDRDVGEAQIEAVVERLSAQGGLDDARFARCYADDKRELAGWGPDRIRGALLERGVAAEHVEAALEGEDVLTQIERAAALLAVRSDPPTDDAERTSALAFLARRGFDSEVAYEAVRRHRRAA